MLTGSLRNIPGEQNQESDSEGEVYETLDKNEEQGTKANEREVKGMTENLRQ